MRDLTKFFLLTLASLAGMIASPARARATRVRRDEPIPVITPRRATEKGAMGTSRGSDVPVLLTSLDYHGTLAAVRNLGRHGVRVTAADPNAFAVAKWSRYASTSVRCPPVRDTQRFFAWLMEYGKSAERHVLLPTCDDTAWLYAHRREELSRYYHVGVPDLRVLHQLLNKRLLGEHAARVALDSPRSWLPTSEADLERIAREASFPVLVKPVTQVLFDSRAKGIRVDTPQQLVPAYRALSRSQHGRLLTEYDPSVAHPIVQEFFPQAQDGIYNVSGHVSDGRIVVAGAARKLLQKPRQLGIGLCFEEAPLDLTLVAALERLAGAVGFNGTFEAEFIEDGDRKVLIDFNPRFYSQMGFDVARGLPLPLLAYREALGDRLERRLENPQPTGRIYAYGSGLKLLLNMQRLSGALSADEARAWSRWYGSRGDALVDAVNDPDDVLPQWIDLAVLVGDTLRHPSKLIGMARAS